MPILNGRIVEMAADRILDFVPASKYSEIRAKDEHPEFRAYAVAYEGESTGELVVGGKSLGSIVKRWTVDIIRQLVEKLKLGTKVFLLHQDTPPEQRSVLGEIVGKAAEFIGDKLNAIYIAYIEPAFRALPLDIPSMEADIAVEASGDGSGVNVVNVKGISGLALGSSKFMKPGFAAATLLATVNEFAAGAQGGAEKMDLTKENVSKWLADNKVKPTEVFPLEVLTDDPQVIKLANYENYKHGKRFEDENAVLKERIKEIETKHAKEIVELKKTSLRASVNEIFEELSKERKLAENVKKFILADLPEFEPSDENFRSALNSFMDKKVNRFKTVAELVTGNPAGESDDGKGKDGGAGDLSNIGPRKKDLTKKENNPFIPDSIL